MYRVLIYFFCLFLLPSGLTAQHASAEIQHLKKHVVALTSTAEPRNHQNLASLNAAADYIKNAFCKLSTNVTEQKYIVNGNEYCNIILTLGPANAPRLIVGAHYDVCGDQPGADDNASGVAGLLELARMLHKKQQLPFRIDLVAYTLEEPPYFRTEHMGSFVHAKSLHQEQIKVIGMISLEMIGYFTNQKNSQRYPLAPMKLVYGSTGDFIGVVQKLDNGSFGSSFASNFKAVAPIKVKSLKAPASVPGIDFSDHLNYWHFGYSALMITDTAFYRNKNYHQTTDTPDTLDFGRMGQVVEGLYRAILRIR